jgi:hypothetical protein
MSAAGNPHSLNPLKEVEAHLTAVLRSIEPQLDHLFKKAVDGGWSEMFLFETMEDAVDSISSFLATIKNLPAFIVWSLEFEEGADGKWFA